MLSMKTMGGIGQNLGMIRNVVMTIHLVYFNEVKQKCGTSHLEEHIHSPLGKVSTKVPQSKCLEYMKAFIFLRI